MRFFIFLFSFVIISGCSSPGKPSFYYPWTQYDTGVNIKMLNEPRYVYGTQGVLRMDDDGEYALIVFYNGGSVAGHFGYATKENIDSWIEIFNGFLSWDPKNDSDKEIFHIKDDVMLFHKEYTVEYIFKDKVKMLLVNNDALDGLFVDYSRLAIDENNVRKLSDLYINIKPKLK